MHALWAMMTVERILSSGNTIASTERSSTSVVMIHEYYSQLCSITSTVANVVLTSGSPRITHITAILSIVISEVRTIESQLNYARLEI